MAHRRTRLAIATLGWLTLATACSHQSPDEASSGEDGGDPTATSPAQSSGQDGDGSGLEVADPMLPTGTGGGGQTVLYTGGTSSAAGAAGATASSLYTGGTSSAMGGATASSLTPQAGADLEDAPDPNAGDDYVPVGTNPFTLTDYDPLSTFAADVDTASYDIFRRDLNNGYLPQPASVRLEEYVNYFRYDYPTPEADAEVPFTVSLAAAPALADRETVMLRVGIQGKAAPAFDKRPTNLVFLVDVSGSMAQSDKLPLVQQVLRMTLAELDLYDTISIVTYASGTGVRLPPTPVSDRVTIEAAIDGLAAGGSTAGAAGIDLAYAQAESAFLEGGINHVLLCTDGDFNVGTSSTDALVELVEEKRRTGITLTVLGFGTGNLNDSMMEAVSNAGNGFYGVISDADQAQSYVSNRLLSTMTLIAKDVKLQIEFNPSHVYAYRLLGYENRAIADDQFRDDAVDAGEVGAGHRVTALYELVLPGVEIPLAEGAPAVKDGESYTGDVEILPEDLVLVKVRYKPLDATETDPALEVSATLAPADLAADVDVTDHDFQWAVAMAAFAEILKQSPYGDPTWLPALEAIFTDPAHAADADRSEFQVLFTRALPLIGR